MNSNRSTSSTSTSHTNQHQRTALALQHKLIAIMAATRALMLVNASVVTMASSSGACDSRVLHHHAILIVGGVIHTVADRAQCQAAASQLDIAVDVVDVGNRLVTPGFISSHEHPAADALAYSW
jgi:predicted amidohydrolase YtcJ